MSKQPLTVGSLFSGIGGIDLGLTRAGMSVQWMVEKDEYARKVLRKHWPETRIYEDVRYIKGPGHDGHWEECDECLSPVDVLAGGFPCQDISVAGKGKGIKEGTRSGLWFEYARLIRELRPKYVLVENVPALRSRGLDRVLGDLAESGYDAEWQCLPASAFGAPHRRDRLFIVAYPKRELVRVESGRGSGQDRPDTVFPSGDGVAGHVADAPGFTERESTAETNSESDCREARDESGSSCEHVADAQRGRHPSNLTEDPTGKKESGSTERRGESGPRDTTGARSAQSPVGGVVDGFSSGLDGHPWSGDWEVGVPRIASAVPSRVDRLRCLGNAVVPIAAEFVGRLIVAHAERNP